MPRNVQRALAPCMSAAYMIVQNVGIVVLMMGMALTVFCTATVARIVIPLVAVPNSFTFVFLCILCSTLSFGILFNYMAAACLRSPLVDAEETARLAREREALPLYQRIMLLEAPARYCQTCGRYKAPREHHCRICRRCVTRMDHHCPWINNCVDAENYRYFTQLLAYVVLGSGITTGVLGRIYWNVLYRGPANTLADGFYGPYGNMIRGFSTVFLFFTCLLMFVSLSLLLIWNFLYLMKNETPIESFIVKQKKRITQHSPYPFRNPYNLSPLLNVLSVFETRGDPVISHIKRGGNVSMVKLILWLMLPTLRASKCDGVHYTTFEDEVMHHI
ncbi:hypothetical protein TRVL_07331 [Trypanosoma vivax]|uniref:Palmitoyltransferase n=1 Tax=Trypanosoma vivax (strain Y486) TaxID=1055687 RepID=G0U564_TRYVY|nr:hypothetical protein TRVL_07331 [Trypanosoma vivax]CCC51012.1 conserved hypothetical protein [Trypanosoma vivax Y486]